VLKNIEYEEYVQKVSEKSEKFEHLLDAGP